MVVVGSARSTLHEGAFYACIATRACPVRVERVGSVRVQRAHLCICSSVTEGWGRSRRARRACVAPARLQARSAQCIMM